MNRQSPFKRIERPYDRPVMQDDQTSPTAARLLERLRGMVQTQYEHITGQPVATFAVELAAEPPPAGPPPDCHHPTCREHIDSDVCRHAWATHLTELTQRPDVHWHRCAFNLWCGWVPVVWQERCLAACKLVMPEQTEEAVFLRHLELLDLLVDRFILEERQSLLQLLLPEWPADRPRPGPLPSPDRRHPQVVNALAHIASNLEDPSLNVASTARALNMNATYLAHLFSEQTGTRMSRHIAIRRMDLARELLTTTTWQIKRVAFETGYANADWFSHVFHAHTGLTPTAYRRKARNTGGKDRD